MKVLAAFFLLLCAHALAADAAAPLDRVRVAADGHGFVLGQTQRVFHPWGMNYGNTGRLMEDFWNDDWATFADDFRELKTLGANVVRLHLQFGKFMEALRHFAVGKPVVIEETFALSCSAAELEEFLRASREIACGWIGHYDGRTLDELDALDRSKQLTMAQAVYRQWLRLFVHLKPEFAAEAGRKSD